MRHLALAALLATSLTGCDRMQAAFTPIPERITAAFPLPDEVELARSRLLVALENDKPAREAAATQFAQLMNARALACTAATPVGRFDTVFRIKAKVVDGQCFTKQDVQLAEWIGVRRIALALRAPPLVPPAPLPAQVLLPSTAEPFASAHLAAQANVLVLRGYQQKVQVLQVPAGKEIASFSIEGSGTPSVSPNGRLLAVPGVKTLRIVEAESGKPLWTTDLYQDLVAWVPQSEVLVLAQSATGAPFMLDTRTGRIEPYPSTEKRLTWSLPVGEGQLLVGHNTSASLMQHGRSSAGALEVHPVRQWTLPDGMNVKVPFLMNQGKRLVYPTYRELSWLDLGTGQQGNWQLSAIGAGSYAQVGDNVVAFQTTAQEGRGMVTMLLDTEKSTIATAKDNNEHGQVFPLTPRVGFLRRGPNALTVTAAMEGEAPQDVERVISEALAARQIAKLNDPYRSDFGSPNPGRTPAQQAYIESLASQVRAMNTQSAIRDGLSKETIDAIRRGQRPSVVAGVQSPGGMPPAPLVGKTVLDVPPDSRIAMVGVYQPPRGGSGRITVRVGAGSTPIVLVLSSYEAVNWMIEPGSRKIAAVLVSGYKPSTVNGQGSAQVVRIGSHHAYKIDSSEFAELRREVARYVGPATPVFQGLYEGVQFQVQ